MENILAERVQKWFWVMIVRRYQVDIQKMIFAPITMMKRRSVGLPWSVTAWIVLIVWLSLVPLTLQIWLMVSCKCRNLRKRRVLLQRWWPIFKRQTQQPRWLWLRLHKLITAVVPIWVIRLRCLLPVMAWLQTWLCSIAVMPVAVGWVRAGTSAPLLSRWIHAGVFLVTIRPMNRKPTC